MAEILQFVRREEFELNQEIDALENEFSAIRNFLDMSPRQRETFVQAKYVHPRESILRMIESLNDVYRKLPRQSF